MRSLALRLALWLVLVFSVAWGTGAATGGSADVSAGGAVPGATRSAAAPTPIPIYGPRQFDTPTGGTAIHVEQFAATLVPGARYVLRVENGAPDGSGRVDSATVRLNGAVVVGPADLGPADTVATRLVDLTDANALEVTVSGSTGAFLTLSVIAEPDPTFTVYGPVRSEVGASSEMVDDTFAIPATAAAPYTLRVMNGMADSTQRVRSGRVEVNGVTILSPNDLNDQVGQVTREVSLTQSGNVVSARVNGNTGSFIELYFTATDTTPPVLEVVAPAAGTVTAATEVTVSGTVQDETATRVTVNGTVAAAAGGGAFSATVPLAADGEHALDVVAVDAAGKQSDTTISVIRDTEPPEVVLTSPVDGLITGDTTVLFQGTVTDLTAVSVQVNAVPLVVGEVGAFAGEVPLSDGANVFTLTATDAADNSTVLVRNIVRDTTPPVLVVVVPVDGTATSLDTITVAGTVSDESEVTLTLNGAAVPVDADGAFRAVATLSEGSNLLAVTATDAGGNAVTETRTVIRQTVEIPPDPTTVAPPLDPTVATTLHAATAFLYTGPDPIQVGVDPDTIDPVRVAVLRGRTLTREGVALPGVTVTVLGHPEYGHTVSRTDGGYDLAVNGGGPLVLDFEKAGYLPAQQSVETPWQDYALAEDVALVPLDPVVTTIDLSDTTSVQVARGSVVADSDGVRQATLLFEPGTTAEMVLPDGSTQPLSTLSVRATEYTVGEGGPRAMPGPLPPNVGYTYAVELSADEAIAAGAQSVVFSRPVAVYVENFLGLPTGEIVPSGYYDRLKAAWVPSDDGRIVEIVGTTVGGLATLDIDGSGQPATDSALASLGITTGERQRLAALYTVGESLWRVPIGHLTPWDFNWPFGPPLGAEPPSQEPGQPDGPPRCEVRQPGNSIIGCESQTLGEAVAIAGTPFSIAYRSNRVPGRTAAYTMDIPLTGDVLPDSLVKIDLQIFLAGRWRQVVRAVSTSAFAPLTTHVTGIINPDFGGSFAPEPNLHYMFTWDGKDSYGRTVQGRQPIVVRIGYVYPAVYYRTSNQFRRAFGALVGSPMTGARTTYTVWQEYTTWIGPWDARGLGLGGWSLNVHHLYVPGTRELYLGHGERRSAETMGAVITTLAGTGASCDNWWTNPGCGNGGPATEADLTRLRGIAAGPDGSLYISDGKWVQRVDPDGIITTVAGGADLCTSGSCGDGGPASQASMASPEGIALGADGSVYIADGGNHRVRRIGPDGIITTVAGTGVAGFSGEGGPATAARLDRPHDVAVAPDGSLYIADVGNERVRRVSPDGVITTVAGTGVRGYNGDGIPSIQANLASPEGIALGEDGSLYIADRGNHRVRRVDPTGVITTFAGTGSLDFSGDGGPAADADLAGPYDVVVAANGDVYIADAFNQRIRRVNGEGIITTVAGNEVLREAGEGIPATRAKLHDPRAVTLGPDGILFVMNQGTRRVRRVGPLFPGLSVTDVAIASEDGSEVYQFDETGRHLRTLDALTGAIRYAFGYDSAGYLATVTDGDGLVTTIERGPGGAPQAIASPFGQRTTLTLDANGYLASVTNPAGEAVRFDYTEDGLLTTLTDPRQYATTFAYDSLGRLERDSDPAGGFKSLARTGIEDGYEVVLETALGRTTRYSVERLPSGATRRRTTDAAGLVSTRIFDPNGTITSTRPDGTRITAVEGADPRFGMQAPLIGRVSLRLPSGLTSTITHTRHTVLEDGTDLLSLVRQTDSVRINGRVLVRTYEDTGRVATTRSPEGRITVAVLDSLSRVVRDSVAGLLAVRFTYDTLGFLSETARGGRITHFDYNAEGLLEAVTDPLGRTDSLFYDPVGRLRRQVLSDGREITFAYDSAGNLTALTPPGRSAHTFRYTPVNLAERYAAPLVGSDSTLTHYVYDLDRQLTHVIRPGGDSLVLAYDSAGRPSALSFDRGLITYGYSPATGNLETITAPGGVPGGNTLAYTYDGSLLTSETWSGEVSGSVGVVYDNDLRVVSQSINGANGITLGYDDDGLLTAAGALAIARRLDNGLISGTTLGTLATARGYNGFGELDSLVAAWSGSTLYRTHYTRDDLGRITGLAETIEGVTSATTFGYDSVGRLLTVERDGQVVEAYEYDSNGNRLRATYPSGTLVGGYDAQDRLISYGSATYAYTAAGELREKVAGADTTRYGYDQLGNLTRVELPDGTVIEYVIDGRNRRVGKKVDGVLVQGFLYAGQLNPVAELDGAGAVVARYVYATRGNVPDYMVRGGGTYRLVSDHLGSVRLVVDIATGTVVQRMDYDAFGRVVLDTSPGFQPFGFAGGLYDRHTGLVRFGARDYDASTGRWTAKDPILFAGGSSNLYGYVLGDPVNLVDSNGRAYFCKRRLGGLWWLGPFSSNPIDDWFNTEISHEQLFFEDDNVREPNIGFFHRSGSIFSGIGDIDPDPMGRDAYVECEDPGAWDDGLMRRALENIRHDPRWIVYKLLGNNCQDFAEELRREYRRLAGGRGP